MSMMEDWQNWNLLFPPKRKGLECPNATGEPGPVGPKGEEDVTHISKPSPFAALLPCSPAKPQRRRVLGGYVSSLLQLATKIPKKIRTILRGSGGPSPKQERIFDDAVRRALGIVCNDALPPLTSEEFERLYCEILEDEVRQGRNAAGIINRFMEERNEIRSVPDSTIRLTNDGDRINKLQDRGFAFDLIQIWKTEKGFHIGGFPTMGTKWFSDLRTAIDEMHDQHQPHENTMAPSLDDRKL